MLWKARRLVRGSENGATCPAPLNFWTVSRTYVLPDRRFDVATSQRVSLLWVAIFVPPLQSQQTDSSPPIIFTALRLLL